MSPQCPLWTKSVCRVLFSVGVRHETEDSSVLAPASWVRAFRRVLLQRPQLQIVVPCMAEGHSIWHFQTDGKEGCPKAVRVPANPREEIADRAFYAAPSIRHVEVATGIQHTGIAAWQSCQQLQIIKLPTSVVSLAEGTWGAMCCVRSLHQGVSKVRPPQASSVKRRLWNL